jgi:HD superfamily phosphodiesterase
MNNSNNLIAHFEPYILKCRPGDWEHAKRVVSWIEKMAGERNDLKLLIMAGYIHDIGWSGLVPKGLKLSREELLLLQPQADKQTDTLVMEALVDFSLSETDLKTILRLIKATETYEAFEEDEMILVDADNLSKTSPEHVKEKYAKSDWLSICDLFEEKFPQRIKTQKGKLLFPKKLEELRKILESELAK